VCCDWQARIFQATPGAGDVDLYSRYLPSQVAGPSSPFVFAIERGSPFTKPNLRDGEHPPRQDGEVAHRSMSLGSPMFWGVCAGQFENQTYVASVRSARFV
jgi:hypothetical protein